MATLDPKKAAQVAYRQARQIQGMITELQGLYDGYNTPEEDHIAGGKYAIGRLISLSDDAFGDDVLPSLKAAVVALVKYGDLLEVAALAIGDNPDWWKEDARVEAARVSPTDFGIVSGFGVPYMLGRMVDGMIDPDDSVSIPATLAEALRGLGVAWLDLDADLDADPKTVKLSVVTRKATATLFDKDGNVVE